MEGKNIMLVAPNTVKGASWIQNNVSDDMLGTAIREAQEEYLVTITGRLLLERLKELVARSIDKLDDNIDSEENVCYKDLLDGYVVPYLVAQSVVSLCLPLTYKIRNVGVVQNSDTNVQAQYIETVAKMQNHFRSDAMRKATALSKWLCKNRKCFDELNASSCGCEPEQPAIGKTFVNVPLNLGNGKKSCC